MNSGKSSPSRLSPHVNPIPNHVPDLEFIHRFVAKNGPGDHWFIRDGRRPDRRHNHRGHAFLKLRVEPTLTTQFVGAGDYCLARLFLEQTRGPFPVRTGFENACGLSQCVNPDHWRPVIPSAVWRFELLGLTNWQLIHNKTGRPSTKDVVVRARGPSGVVHVFATGPAAQSASRVPTALCGASFYPLDLRVTRDAVTCEEGC